MTANTEQPRRIRLTFLTRSLDFGGAQRQLATLARSLDKRQFDVSILTFYSGQPLEHELENSGVTLVSLDKRGRWELLTFFNRLVREVRALQPDILHSYLDIPNVLALLVKRFVPTRIVWGVRASSIELQHYDWLFKLAFKLERAMSGYPDLIILNSHAALKYHLSIGFPAQKLKLIPNGIDTETFKPDPEARTTVRREWGVPESAPLIGTVGRLDPVKGIPFFLKAVTLVGKQRAEARFVCIGDGPITYAERLKSISTELGINDKVIWAGARSNMTAAYNALDLLVSSSLGESFPNAVAEAMSCGVPCVVTAAGDSASLVGDCGQVVPVGDPEALVASILSSLDSNRMERGRQSRVRIVENFGLEKLASNTEAELKRLIL